MNTLPDLPTTEELMAQLKRITSVVKDSYTTIEISAKSYRNGETAISFRAYVETLGLGPECDTLSGAIEGFINNPKASLERKRADLEAQLARTNAALASV